MPYIVTSCHHDDSFVILFEAVNQLQEQFFRFLMIREPREWFVQEYDLSAAVDRTG